MAVYLKMSTPSGEVEGDVVDPENYKGRIRLDSVNWDYWRPSFRDGSGMLRITGPQHAQSRGVTFNCRVGQHVILIWQALALNHLVDAEIRYDTSDDGDDPSLIITLGKAKVSRCDVNSDTFSFHLLIQDMEIEHPESAMVHFDTLAHQG